MFLINVDDRVQILPISNKSSIHTPLRSIREVIWHKGDEGTIMITCSFVRMSIYYFIILHVYSRTKKNRSDFQCTLITIRMCT